MAELFRRREVGLAAILIGVLFLLNLSIASRSPFGGWMDEVSYADVGLNLASGKGWTTTAYPYQTDREFVAGFPPLYPAGLALWVKVFGISMVSARAYCYFLDAIGTFLFWLGAYRFRLFTPGWRLLWILLLSTEYAMNWIARNERYDVWIYVGMAIAWAGASLRAPIVRYALIFLGAFIGPWAGLICAPYFVLLSVLAAGLSRFRLWKESLAGMIGLGSGLVGIVLFFAAFGRLQAFRACISHMTATEQEKFYHLRSQIFLYPKLDPSIAVLILLLILFTGYWWSGRLKQAAPWLGLAWGAVLLVPLMMELRGLFVMMYFYMVIIPLSLGLFQLATRARESSRYLPLAVTWACALLCLTGLPLRMYSSIRDWDFRDPRHIEEFVHDYARPGDRVYSDYLFYFALRDHVQFVAVPFYFQVMPEDEAQAINVAILKTQAANDPAMDSSGLKKFGRGWTRIADFPTAAMLAEHPSGDAGTSYTLYRRNPASP